jgi:hypothetical protein
VFAYKLVAKNVMITPSIMAIIFCYSYWFLFSHSATLKTGWYSSPSSARGEGTSPRYRPPNVILWWQFKLVMRVPLLAQPNEQDLSLASIFIDAKFPNEFSAPNGPGAYGSGLAHRPGWASPPIRTHPAWPAARDLLVTYVWDHSPWGPTWVPHVGDR